MKKRIVRSFALLLCLSLLLALPLPVFATIDRANRTLNTQAGEEGAVLLKNENQALPVALEEEIALFGSTQVDYLVGGGGSSVMFTNTTVTPIDGLRAAQAKGYLTYNTSLPQKYTDYVGERKQIEAIYGEDAFNQTEYKDYSNFEMPLTQELMEEVTQTSRVAVYLLSRFATEGDDLTATPGSYYLTDAEKEVLRTLNQHFDKVIAVLNIPCAIDTTPFLQGDTAVDALLSIWYPGANYGTVLAELLCGVANPSGKTTITFAQDYTDYYSASNFDNTDTVYYVEDIYVGYRQFETFDPHYTTVNFCFGHGLSYTSFGLGRLQSEVVDNTVQVTCSVKNTGERAGKEVLQLYCKTPGTKLGAAGKVLCAFVKTGLLNPGEIEEVTLSFPLSDIASYDDTGVISKSAYVLEAGDYEFYLGNSIRDAGSRASVLTYHLEADTITKQTTERASCTVLPFRLTAQGTLENLTRRIAEKNETKILGKTDMVSAPAEKILFSDVVADESKMSAFIAQLTVEQMAALAGGQAVTVGAAAGNIGGDILAQYGLPTFAVTDGTSGVRVDSLATYFPCGICIASTWNQALAEEVGAGVGSECQKSGIDVWLAPGLNIIRNPLCGRNFEYCSEDPLLSGMMAGAVTRGVQSKDIAVCLKHYAANNKEKNRGPCDSQVSERALREIYLKTFEICIKVSDPWSIMSTCGTVNGTGAAGNYDLMYAILREEYGFSGFVMSDWANMDGEAEELWAGHNLSMPSNNPNVLISAYQNGTVTRAQLEWNTECLLSVLRKLYTAKK